MKRLFFISLLILFFLPGCTKNIRNMSTNISPTESIIVGHIETVPVLWEFSLYEEESKTEDQIDIAGEGFGLTRAGKLQNRGYIFKIVRPGIYVLRLQKRMGGRNNHDNILRITVPEGKLVYLGTIKIVIENVSTPSIPGYGKPNQHAMMFKYRYAGINEDETLRYFADQYPQVYSSYKDKIIRMPAPSRPTYMTLLPADPALDHDFALVSPGRSGRSRACAASVLSAPSTKMLTSLSWRRPLYDLWGQRRCEAQTGCGDEIAAGPREI